eukprot:5366738-Alexandrium_andersonii.AAC.1
MGRQSDATRGESQPLTCAQWYDTSQAQEWMADSERHQGEPTAIKADALAEHVEARRFKVRWPRQGRV